MWPGIDFREYYDRDRRAEGEQFMSEYQYYEFQAVDRPLTPTQRDELRAYSSRAKITANSFINSYNYGDLKGNPEKWMEKYFDAFLYFANWGSHWLMLRLPKKLIDQDIAEAYCADESFYCIVKADVLIFSFRSEDEGGNWSEEGGWLTSLLPIRSDLMAGDYRALYLGWLTAVQSEEIDDDILEPPVPPGLGNLTASLDRLADFLRLDRDLIAAAAESSLHKETAIISRQEIVQWIQHLSTQEKEAILFRVIERDDPHLGVEFRQRVRIEREGRVTPPKGSQRTAGEIRARAEILTEERKRIETEKRVRNQIRRKQEDVERRKKQLESMAGKEDIFWDKVEKLISTKQPKRYDEAVSLLQDLKDLADYKDHVSVFSSQMRALVSKHIRKDTLIKKIQQGKLLKEIIKEGL